MSDVRGGGSLALPGSPVEVGIRDGVICCGWRKQSVSDTSACVCEGGAHQSSQVGLTAQLQTRGRKGLLSVTQYLWNNGSINGPALG